MKEIVLFYSYAPEDRLLRDRLEKHLSILKYLNYVTTWHDREIRPGSEWAKEIDAHLEQAHIILLLVSADFLASGYCYGYEMRQALQLHEQGKTHVIPVLLRPVDWKEAPFEKLQVLPKNARPVTSWRQRDEAFVDIALGIRAVVEKLRQPSGPVVQGTPQDKELLVQSLVKVLWDRSEDATSDASSLSSYYQEALVGYISALHKAQLQGGNIPHIAWKIGDALRAVGQYNRALKAYEQVSNIITPNSLCGQAAIYYHMGNFQHALDCYEYAAAVTQMRQRDHTIFPYAAYSCSILAYLLDNHEAALGWRKSALSSEALIDETYPDWEYALEAPEGYRNKFVVVR